MDEHQNQAQRDAEEAAVVMEAAGWEITDADIADEEGGLYLRSPSGAEIRIAGTRGL